MAQRGLQDACTLREDRTRWSKLGWFTTTVSSPITRLRWQVTKLECSSVVIRLITVGGLTNSAGTFL